MTDEYKPTAADVKALREWTGAGMLECRNALVETNGDLEAALKLLRERGAAKAAKRGGRTTNEGKIGAYIHGGDARKGVLVDVGCETDFVANTERFSSFVKDLTLQIVSSEGTRYVSVEEVPDDVRQAELDLYLKQAKDKPENVRPKIAEGRLEKWYTEVVLLRQPYFRDESKTVEEVRAALSAETGENIEIKRFARYEVGQD